MSEPGAAATEFLRSDANYELGIELEQETDGRWIAEIDELDGVLVHGETKDEAIRNVKTLALRVIADRLENEDL